MAGEPWMMDSAEIEQDVSNPCNIQTFIEDAILFIQNARTIWKTEPIKSKEKLICDVSVLL